MTPERLESVVTSCRNRARAACGACGERIIVEVKERCSRCGVPLCIACSREWGNWCRKQCQAS